MKVTIGAGALDVNEIAAMCGGTPVGIGAAEAFCTDSREATDASTMFVAMVGERVDGHSYMKRAYEGGCRLFLCERIPEELDGLSFGAVLVSSTAEALGQIASAYMARLARPSVGVTGSVGKTTTKEFIAAVLGEAYKLHKTKANHNSTIGVPMSMLEADGSEEVSVVEMGMSGFGEIDFMSRIVKPGIACVTNIGSSHLELLGTRENICRAKLEIVSGMPRDGLLIVNGDEPLLRAMCPASVRVKYVSFEDPCAEIFVTNVRYGCDGTRFDLTVDGETLSDVYVSVIGKPFVWAAAFAVAVGREMGLSQDIIRRGLLSFQNAAMRQSITVEKEITFIEDCYNASPESVRAAIDVMKTLSEQNGTRMVALLGDMLELGEGSVAFHKAVGQYYAEHGGEVLFTMGALSQHMAEGALENGLDGRSVTSVPTYQGDDIVATLGDKICEVLRSGDVFLVKASRSVGAERVLAYVKNKLLHS